MNVLSLFDGMSCGRIALDRAGITVGKYYASEIDKYAMNVSADNYPDIIQVGDVENWREWDINWGEVDLLIGGPPCQGFSFAGKQLAFDDPRSKLFFVYVDILNHIRSMNPDVKFLLENVRMKKEYLGIISEHLEVEPEFINSALVAAQNRQRYYWANWEFGQPFNACIVLADIIGSGLTDREKSFCIDANYFKGGNLKSYFEKHRRQRVFEERVINPDEPNQINPSNKANGCQPYMQDRIYRKRGKSHALPAAFAARTNTGPLILQRARGVNKGGLKARDGKTPSLTSSCWYANNHLTLDGGLSYRKLTPVECERLQTVPDNYTSGVSNTQRYKMLGNGWTVDVIAHIFRALCNDDCDGLLG